MLLLALVLLFLSLFVYRRLFQIRALKGPVGFPLLGHLPRLGKNPRKAFLKWKTKYGPVFCINIGSTPFVFINDPLLMKEAFGKHQFSSRVSNAFNKIYDGKGIMTNPDVQGVAEQRRFSQKCLKGFGLAGDSLESKILTEVLEFIDLWKKRCDVPLRIDQFFYAPITNVLWNLMMSRKFSHDDAKIAYLGECFAKVAAPPPLIMLSLFTPLLEVFLRRLPLYKEYFDTCMQGLGFVREQLLEHKKTYVVGQPRDMADAFWDKIAETTDITSSFHAKNEYQDITMENMFVAGTETTTTAMDWVLFCLTKYPETQNIIFGEINEILGENCVPRLSDRILMPQTEAFINEVFRYSSVVPWGLLHMTTENLVFEGIEIPKGTGVMGNIEAVNYDPKIWGDPQNFRLERFIGPDGKYQKNENLIPFGIGKRNCIGEGLARDEIFLLTVRFVQTFKVRFAVEPTVEPTFAFIKHPPPFDVILAERETKAYTSPS